jgi:hypothetical protein
MKRILLVPVSRSWPVHRPTLPISADGRLTRRLPRLWRQFRFSPGPAAILAATSAAALVARNSRHSMVKEGRNV